SRWPRSDYQPGCCGARVRTASKQPARADPALGADDGDRVRICTVDLGAEGAWIGLGPSALPAALPRSWPAIDASQQLRPTGPPLLLNIDSRRERLSNRLTREPNCFPLRSQHSAVAGKSP